MNPTVCGVSREELAEGQAASVSGISGLLVNTSHEGGDNTSRSVCGASGQKDIVRVPVNLGDSGIVLLQVLADPPVVILLEVANSH